MKHTNVSPEALKQILESSAWESFGIKIKVEEAKKEEPKVEESKKEETKVEEHSCPLCSSKLTEAISDEKLLNHTEQILKAVQEANAVNESSDEDEDEDEFEEYDEEDEVESDEDEDEEVDEEVDEDDEE